MNPTSIIALARDAGVRISTEGTQLVLEATTQPPVGILDLITKFKAEILQVLSSRRTPHVRSAEDWQALFHERAGIAEFDGGLSRSDAEGAALQNCIAEWISRNPVASHEARCLWCAGEVRSGAMILPFGVSSTGHAWLHSDCWTHWRRWREAEAIAALAASGVPNAASDPRFEVTRTDTVRT